MISSTSCFVMRSCLGLVGEIVSKPRRRSFRDSSFTHLNPSTLSHLLPSIQRSASLNNSFSMNGLSGPPFSLIPASSIGWSCSCGTLHRRCHAFAQGYVCSSRPRPGHCMSLLPLETMIPSHNYWFSGRLPNCPRMTGIPCH